jgi:hypothetical protein
MNPSQAFEKMLQAIEPPDSTREKAGDQLKYMREQLQQRLPTLKVFISGSYGRKTAIAPLHDIDLFVVLDRTKVNIQSPEKLLQHVKETIEAIYPGKTVRVQDKSVNISFSGTGIDYDVVPAYDDGHWYLVPNGTKGTWVKSDPEIHKEASTAANHQANQALKPLVKAVKLWNTEKGKVVKSFHLEVMTQNILTTKPDSRLDALADLFTALVDEVAKDCPEPAGLGPHLSEGVNVAAAQSAFRHAAILAREAAQAARDGDEGHANHCFSTLFGPAWPDKGKPRTPKATVPPISGIDSSNGRFG